MEEGTTSGVDEDVVCYLTKRAALSHKYALVRPFLSLQFSQQPLVPIGCATTAYFLASGIKSFRDRDPVKSQRMMKYRVMAQFVTLICFCGYIGYDNMDWRIAPMYQDAKKVRQYQKGQQESEKGTD